MIKKITKLQNAFLLHTKTFKSVFTLQKAYYLFIISINKNASIAKSIVKTSTANNIYICTFYTYNHLIASVDTWNNPEKKHNTFNDAFAYVIRSVERSRKSRVVFRTRIWPRSSGKIISELPSEQSNSLKFYRAI